MSIPFAGLDPTARVDFQAFGRKLEQDAGEKPRPAAIVGARRCLPGCLPARAARAALSRHGVQFIRLQKRSSRAMAQKPKPPNPSMGFGGRAKQAGSRRNRPA
jgi:hypothetical protein